MGNGRGKRSEDSGWAIGDGLCSLVLKVARAAKDEKPSQRRRPSDTAPGEIQM